VLQIVGDVLTVVVDLLRRRVPGFADHVISFGGVDLLATFVSSWSDRVRCVHVYRKEEGVLLLRKFSITTSFIRQIALLLKLRLLWSLVLLLVVIILTPASHCSVLAVYSMTLMAAQSSAVKRRRINDDPNPESDPFLVVTEKLRLFPVQSYVGTVRDVHP
jgi:hypothetical protein